MCIYNMYLTPTAWWSLRGMSPLTVCFSSNRFQTYFNLPKPCPLLPCHFQVCTPDHPLPVPYFSSFISLIIYHLAGEITEWNPYPISSTIFPAPANYHFYSRTHSASHYPKDQFLKYLLNWMYVSHCILGGLKNYVERLLHWKREEWGLTGIAQWIEHGPAK